MLTLAEMSEEEAIKIFKAWRAGELEVVYSSIASCDASVSEPLEPSFVYRVKRTPITLDWSPLAPEWRWAARDLDGVVRVFNDRPKRILEKSQDLAVRSPSHCLNLPALLHQIWKHLQDVFNGHQMIQGVQDFEVGALVFRI